MSVKYTVTMPPLPAAASDDVFVLDAWEKDLGDVVYEGDTLALVRPGLLGDGAPVPVPAPTFGVLARRSVLPGEAIEVGEPLAVLAGVPVPATPPAEPAPELPLPVYAPNGPEEAAARTPLDAALAAHHAHSWRESPHVFTVAVADVTEAVRLCARVARGETVSGEAMALTLLPFVLRAAADALTRFPTLNSRFAEMGDGAEVCLRRYVRLGWVTRDGAGREVVPVVRDPDRASVLALARELADQAERARAGTLTEADVCGATFTVAETPPGVLYQTPVLHRPQAALLAFGAPAREPVVVGGEEDGTAERIEVRSRVRLCLAHDARLVPPADAAAFLTEVAAILGDARFLFA